MENILLPSENSKKEKVKRFRKHNMSEIEDEVKLRSNFFFFHKFQKNSNNFKKVKFFQLPTSVEVEVLTFPTSYYHQKLRLGLYFRTHVIKSPCDFKVRF